MNFSLRGTSKTLWTALRMLLALTVVLGVVYPLAIAAFGLLAPGQAQGSMLARSDGTVVGSRLIGQEFPGDEWFHGRPSAAGDGYDSMSSGASNLSPTNPDLTAAVSELRASIAAENGVTEADVPLDAVTASGSGLDPHISPAYARIQVNRVAAARGIDPATVVQLVGRHSETPLFGLGEPQVNVLELNLALDELSGK